MKEWLSAVDRTLVYDTGPADWQDRLNGDLAVQVVMLGPCGNSAEQARVCEVVRNERPNLAVILYNDDAAAPFPVEHGATGFLRTIRFPVDRGILPELLTEAVAYANERNSTAARNPELF